MYLHISSVPIVDAGNTYLAKKKDHVQGYEAMRDFTRREWVQKLGGAYTKTHLMFAFERSILAAKALLKLHCPEDVRVLIISSAQQNPSV